MTTANISLGVKSSQAEGALDELLGKIKTVKTQLEELNRLVPEDKLTAQLRAQVAGANEVGSALNKLTTQVRATAGEQAQALRNLASTAQATATQAAQSAAKIAGSYKNSLSGAGTISFKIDDKLVAPALAGLKTQVSASSAEAAQSLKNLMTDVQSAAGHAAEAAGASAKKVSATYKEALGGGFNVSFKMDEGLARAAAMGPFRATMDTAQIKQGILGIKNDWAAAEEARRRDGRSTALEMLRAEADRAAQGRATGQTMLKAELDRRQAAAETGRIMTRAEADRQAQGRAAGQEMLRWELVRQQEGRAAGQDMLRAELERRAQGKATAQEMLKADLDRAAQGKATGQVMLKAELDRAAQGRATGQEMLRWELVRQQEGKKTAMSQLIAETDRREQGKRTAQDMLKAELDRAAQAKATGQEMLRWELVRQQEGKKTAMSQLIAETERREEGKRTAQTMLRAEVERAAQAKATGQEMLKAELDRAAQGKATGQVMLKAELDRSAEGRKTGQEMLRWELVRQQEGKQTAMSQLIAETERREQGKRTGQEMLKAELDRKQEARATGQEMMRWELARKTEARTVAQEMQRAELERRDQAKATGQEMLRADMERRQQGKATAQEMLRAETERAEKLRQATANTNFLNDAGRTQVQQLERQLRIMKEAFTYSQQPGVSPSLVKEKYGSVAASFANPTEIRMQENAIANARAYATAQAQLAQSGSAGATTAMKAADATRAHAAAMREAHSAARGLAAGFDAMWLTWGSILPLMAGFAISSAMKEAVQGFTQVQYQMTFVKALGDDATISVSKLAHELHEVSKGLGISPEDASKGMRVLAQAGLSATQALSALPDVFRLATVGEIEMGTAANALIGVLNAFDLSKSSIGYVGDVMAKAGAMSATSVAAMAESMKVAAPVAAQFKFSLEETAMALTALAKINITGSAAGTSVKNMMQELAAPTSKKSRTVMEMLGFKAFDKEGEMKPLIAQVEELRGSLQKYDRESQGKILTTLFGAKGEKAFFSLLKQAKEDSEKMLGDLSNSNGFNAGVFSQLQQTTKGQFDLLKSAIANTFSGIGEVADAPLANFLRTLRGFLELGPVTSAIKGFGQSLVTLGSFAVTYGAPVLAFLGSWKLAAFAVGGTISILTSASATITAMGVAATAAGGGVAGLGAAMSLLAKNPLMLLLTGLTMAVSLTLLLREAKQSVIDKASNEIKAINDTASAIEKENEQRAKKLVLMGQGKSAAEAESLAKVQEADDAAQAVQNELKSLRESQAYRDQKASSEKRRKPGQPMVLEFDTGIQGNAALQQERALVAKSQELQDAANRLRSATRTRMEQVKKEKELADAETKRMAAELAKLMPAGSLKYDPDAKTDKGARAAANDQYRASQKDLDGQLEEARDKAKYNIERAISENRRSQLGDLQLINLKLAENTKMRESELATYIKKEQLAARTENRKTDEASIDNKKDALGRAQSLDEMQAEEARAAYINKVNDAIVKSEADTARDRGQLYKAFMLEWEAANRDTLAKVYADLNDPKVEAKLKAAAERMLGFMNQEYQSGSTNALFNEKKAEYDKLKAQMDEQLAAADEKGSARSGVGGALIGLSMAEDIRSQALPALKQLQDELAKLAKESGNPNLSKAVANLGRDLAKDANRASDAWRTAGRTIERSLADAFGKGGKAIGGMIRATMDYGDAQQKINEKLEKDKQGKNPAEIIELENKARKDSAQVTLSTYADMAGAAKGFFDTQSTGYTLLLGAERAFRTVEMALAAEAFIRKTFFASATATATVAAIGVGTTANVASVAPNVAADGAKATSSGIVAVAKSLASLPFPFNIAAGAVTLAALVGMGVAMTGGMGGGGSVPRDIAKDRQDRAGTSFQGRAYEKGDEAFEFEMVKSEAIAKSLDLLAENSKLGLGLTNGMLRNLESIKANIGSMASFISQASGMRGTKVDAAALGLGTEKNYLSKWLAAFTPAFSKSTTTLEDSGLLVAAGQTIGSVIVQGLQANSYQDIKKESSSWFGLKKSTDEWTNLGPVEDALTEKFSNIIRGMTDTVADASTFLGAGADEVRAKLMGMGVDLGKISFKGMKADEIQAELEAVFGKLGDDMAKTVMPGVAQFNKAGEDYLTTLVRVSSGVEQAQQALDEFGLTAVSLSALVNKTGDITAEIIRQTITESESTWYRLSSWGGGNSTSVQVMSQIGKIIDQLPGDASDLVEAYRELVQIRYEMKSIGLNTDGLTMEAIKGAGGLDKLASGMSDYMSSFFTDAQQNAAKASQLTDQLKAMGVSLPRTKEDFVELVSSINMTSLSGQKLYGQLMAISGEFADVADAVGYVIPELIKLRGTITDEAPDRKPKTLVEEAKEWADILKNMRDLRDTVSEAIYDQRKTALEAYADRELTSEQLAEQKSLQQELADMRAQQESDSAARIADLWAAISVDGLSAEQQLDLAGQLKDEILDRYEVEKENSKDLLNFAKKLREYVQDLRTGDKSPLTLTDKISEAKRQYDTTLAKANAGDSTAMDALQGKADTYLELARTAYASSESYKAIFAAVTGQLDAAAAAAEGQVKPLTAEQQQVDELKKLQDFLNQTTAAANTKYDQIATTLAQQLIALQNMEAAYGVQSTVPDILKGLPVEIAAAMINAGVGRSDVPQTVAAPLPASTYTPTATSTTVSSFYSVNFGRSDAINGSHADGLGYVPFDGYIAELHRGERVMTASENARYGVADAGTAQMAAEIRALRQEVAQLRAEQNAQTGALIHAHFDATDRAADKVVDGVSDAADNAGWKQSSAATLR